MAKNKLQIYLDDEHFDQLVAHAKANYLNAPMMARTIILARLNKIQEENRLEKSKKSK